MEKSVNILHWELNASVSVEQDLLNGLNSKTPKLRKTRSTKKMDQEGTPNLMAKPEKAREISENPKPHKHSLFEVVKTDKVVTKRPERPSKTMNTEEQVKQEIEIKKRKGITNRSPFNQGIDISPDFRLPMISKTSKVDKEQPSEIRKAGRAATLHMAPSHIEKLSQHQTIMPKLSSNHSTRIEPSMSMHYPILTTPDVVDKLSKQFNLNPGSFMNNMPFSNNINTPMNNFSQKDVSSEVYHTPHKPAFGSPQSGFSQAMEVAMNPTQKDHPLNKMRNLFESPRIYSSKKVSFFKSRANESNVSNIQSDSNYVPSPSFRPQRQSIIQLNSPKMNESATPVYNFSNEKRFYLKDPIPLGEILNSPKSKNPTFAGFNSVFTNSALYQLGSSSPIIHRRNPSTYKIDI